MPKALIALADLILFKEKKIKNMKYYVFHEYDGSVMAMFDDFDKAMNFVNEYQKWSIKEFGKLGNNSFELYEFNIINPDFQKWIKEPNDVKTLIESDF